VPVLLYSPFCRPDAVTTFNERACVQGALATIPAVNLMPLAMANALRFTKYGA
jgi:2,3-bisphosphoglycerate-independent phosphoglycerate mutase